MDNRLKHQALPALLDRELAIAAARPLIDKYSPYLEELVNFATCAWARCEKSLRGVGGTPFALLALYYHAIQMADASQVLISQSCFSAAVPNLRSLLEAELSIEYILKGDYERRSAAWLVAHYLEQQEFLDRLDPDSERGKHLRQSLQGDKLLKLSAVNRLNIDAMRQGRKSIDDVLAKPKFAAIARSLVKKNGRIRKWYEINGGPKSLSQLARQLGRLSQYRFQYSTYSSVLHAHDASNLLEHRDGAFALVPIRSGSSPAEEVCYTAALSLAHATKMIVAKFRPDEEIGAAIRELMKRHRHEGGEEQDRQGPPPK